MGTVVQFYTEPLNIDYLMMHVRFRFGDFDGSVFSDQIIRTSIVNAVLFLQKRFDGKYQVYKADAKIDPQPAGVPSGYIRINSLHGYADVINTIVDGSIFRDPYVVFSASNPPLFESIDEEAVILAAVYLLRKVQLSSSAGAFVSWSTEDIRFSNAGYERGVSALLDQDLATLNNYIKSSLGKPKRADFPIAYIPQLTELGL